MSAGAEPHRFPVHFAFGEPAVDCEPVHVRGYAEQSLRNLGAEVVDLYHPHLPDPQVPFEDTVGAVAEPIADGPVRHLGVSRVGRAAAGRARGAPRRGGAGPVVGAAADRLGTAGRRP
ncbi:aldo/keto reductase family protein [Kitasatospora sp. SolWspMP-SS2h]|uniref:aldo/keto reductase n=1 Tax=Kitasatospora sp. SolWspMP-SS2h TaxID=1305729 RepID=UPI000DC001CB|nr:aldo/keto reductase [Kitasatospora sp. SolWspMP-SS2h]RAJ42622.1 aldo/keto reductase family protein [Kitasatospora sp. SolWspMP-SS2h]